MSNAELYYLRPNVQVEPLIDRWYAWPHLIPPATAARNLTERHIRIMESYIAAPRVHASAVSNPKMSGGPFIDYGGRRVDEIRNLLKRTQRDRAELIRLSAAIEELDHFLMANAKGGSMRELYPHVPDELRGCVELVYDLNKNPSFRLIEPFLYRSTHYSHDSQSIMLSVITGDDRPFVLSTPRLDNERAVHLAIPFCDAAIDYIFRLKAEPRPLGEIFERCRVPLLDQPLFGSFLTRVAPRKYLPYQGDGIRWRYFGHACILVEARNLSLLCDPVLSYTYQSSISRYTYEDLPEFIDYVLITHNHQDHVLLETLLQLRHKIKHLVVPKNGGGSLQDPSLRLALEAIGFSNILELDELQEIESESAKIVAIPFIGEHADLNIRTKSAYLVSVGSHSLLLAADSCNYEPALYTRVRSTFGRVDTLFLGMECDGAPLSWLYGPLLTQPISRSMDEARRLSGSNHDQALAMISALGCSSVFIYAMGQEPWLSYITSIKYTPESNPIVQSDRLLETCRGLDIFAERLFGERELLIDRPKACSNSNSLV